MKIMSYILFPVNVSHASVEELGNTDDEVFLTESEEEIDVDANQPVSSGRLKQIEFVRKDKFLIPLPGQGRPTDLFNTLLDEVLLENIIKYTNRNALHVYTHTPGLTPKSRIQYWKDLTVPELKKNGWVCFCTQG